MNPNISFLYTVDPDADEPIMLIDKHVGFDEVDGWGIMGDLFQKELLALDGMEKKRIQVWINSPGGIVADGYNIYNAMLKSKTPVDTYNMGIAASIAGVLFQGGRKRIMADYSKLMYHNPYGGDDDKGLAAIRDSLATMIASRCGKPEVDVLAIMNKTTWIAADEALENGFCDEVQHSGEINKKRGSVITDAKALWKEAASITNSLLPNNNNNSNSISMKKVANRLKLVPDATEDSIIEAIDKLESEKAELTGQVKNHLTDIQNRKSNMEKKEEECKALEEELNKAKNELEEMKKKAKAKEDSEKEKEEKEKEEKAKNMIDGFVKDGRIKNEEKTISAWVAKAKDDYDGVKNMIEGLPINKQAAKIVTTTESREPKGGSLIANKMSTLLLKATKL